MLPKTHFIINFIIAIILLSSFKQVYVLIYFLASILIDFDHYLYYIIEEKDFSLKKAYKWYIIKKEKLKKLPEKERSRHKRWILIFHGIEPAILVLILSLFFPPALFIFIGFLSHMIQDLFEDIPLGVVKNKLFLSYSIYNHFKTRKQNLI